MSKTYKVVRASSKKMRKLDGKINIVDGYMLKSRSRSFTFLKTSVSNIRVINREFIHNLVKKKVDIRFENLMKKLVLLLISDDDTGESARLILDRVEKFRQEIKNKYKMYLTKKELDELARQLVHMQKEAKMKMILISNRQVFEMPEREMSSPHRSR